MIRINARIELDEREIQPERLIELIREACEVDKPHRPTRPHAGVEETPAGQQAAAGRYQETAYREARYGRLTERFSDLRYPVVASARHRS